MARKGPLAVPHHRRLNLTPRHRRPAAFQTTIPTPRPPARMRVRELFAKDRHNPTRPSEWQPECFYYSEVIGEVGYVLNVKANTVAECDLRVVQDDDNGDPIEADDPRALRVREALRGPLGDRRELMRRAALHMEIGGETYLVGTDAEGGGIQWEFLSTEEIKVDQSGKVRRVRSARESGSQEHLGPDVYLDRLYRPDARFSSDPDCALRKVRTICNEVVVLTQLVDAVAKSRLAAGVLFVPEEITFADDDEEPGDDDLAEGFDGEESETERFTARLFDHLGAPITDRASASSLVPMVLRAAAEHGDKIKVIDLARGLDSWAKELREEALHRLAAGLDIPQEVMEGKGGLNHWTGYIVDADFVSKHVLPLGQLIANFLTDAYLRPMLVEEEGLTAEQAARYRFEFDDTPIMARSDEAQNARYLYDRMELSGDALRRYSGFSEGDAPEDDEFRFRVLLQMIRSAPATMNYLLPALGPQFEDLPDRPATQAGGDDVDAEGRENTVALPGPDGGDSDDEPTPTSGAEEPEPAGPQLAVDRAIEAFTLVQRLATAADSYMDRALERAGARIVSKLSGGDKARVAKVDKAQLLGRFGERDLAAMGESYDTLLDWSRFRDRARPWLVDWAQRAGEVDGFVAQDQADRMLDHLCASMTRLAAAGGREVFANGLRVPDDAVAEAMASVALVEV